MRHKICKIFFKRTQFNVLKENTCNNVTPLKNAIQNVRQIPSSKSPTFCRWNVPNLNTCSVFLSDFLQKASWGFVDPQVFYQCDIWMSEYSRFNYFAMLAFYSNFRRWLKYRVQMNLWKLFWMNDRLQQVRWPLKDLQRGLFAAAGQKRDQNSLGHGSALKEGERQ